MFVNQDNSDEFFAKIFNGKKFDNRALEICEEMGISSDTIIPRDRQEFRQPEVSEKVTDARY